MTPKTYVPKSCAKKHQFQGGGTILKLSFDAKALADFAREHQNAKGYLNLVVAERREVGKFGDTHYVYLDTFEPKPRDAVTAPPARSSAPQEPEVPMDNSDDVPF